MSKEIIQTDEAPKPIGPYNQAILAGNTLYISGQIAMVPATGVLSRDDIETETKMVMQNLNAILVAADMDFSHVVKTTIYIMDMNDFSAINEIYANYFDEHSAPARETIQVSRLPKDARVEISMIGVK